MSDEKKPHWTQTPEGRAKLTKSLKKAWRKRKAKPKPKKTRAQVVMKRAIKKPQFRFAARLITVQNGVEVEEHRFNTWGQFLDIVLDLMTKGVRINEALVREIS